MSLRVEENYASGIPQTAVASFAPRGLAWHWTAGGVGRAGALSTIRHFQNTRYTVNASYHLLVWAEHRAGHVGCTTFAMWIVRSSKASHSLNPSAAFKVKTGSARELARFAEVHRILARDSDPNADCISVSYCGMPANLAADVKCPIVRADLKELARQLIAHPAVIDRPHFGHGWIQPTTRYETDATTGGADLLIAAVLYAAELAQEDDMPTLDRYALETVTLDKGARIRSAPSNGDVARSFTTRTDRFSTVVSIGDLKNADGPWTVYWVNDWEAWGYTRSDLNVKGREPYANTVEVPSGVPKAEYDAALEQVSALTTRVRLKDEYEATTHANYPKG